MELPSKKLSLAILTVLAIYLAEGFFTLQENTVGMLITPFIAIGLYHLTLWSWWRISKTGKPRKAWQEQGIFSP